MSHKFYERDARINSHDRLTIKGDELLLFIVISMSTHTKFSISENL